MDLVISSPWCQTAGIALPTGDRDWLWTPSGSVGSAEQPVYASILAASPDGAWIVAWGMDIAGNAINGGLLVYDSDTARWDQWTKSNVGAVAQFYSAAVSPDGSKFVVGRQGSIQVFDVDAAAKTVTGSWGITYDYDTRYDGTTRGLAWSPDGTKIVAGTQGAGLLLIDVASQTFTTPVAQATVPPYGTLTVRAVRDVSWSSDGGLVAFSIGQVCVFSYPGWTQVYGDGDHLNDAGTVEFSPDGSKLAYGFSVWNNLGTYTETYRVVDVGSWAIESGWPQPPLDAYQAQQVVKLGWSQDGAYLGCGLGNTPWVWPVDAIAKQDIPTFTPDDMASAVAFTGAPPPPSSWAARSINARSGDKRVHFQTPGEAHV